MPTTEYPKNPNVDTAFVTDNNNKRNRALKTVLVDGTIDYPSNSNSTGCYVTIDGKKQRAMMTADISSAGTLEYPENSNSTKGYVTVNGKKQRVVLTAAIAGGGTPINNQDISVTENGTYTADEGYTGLGTVEVNVPNPSTGTMYIISNGTYNVADKAIANVNVPTTAPAHYIEKINDNGTLKIGSTLINLNGITNIGNYALYYAYYNNASITGNIDLSSLQTINGSYGCSSAFYYGSGITSVDLSSLQTINGNYACEYMFRSCGNITSINLSNLENISGNYACRGMFNSNSKITNVNLSNLKNIQPLSSDNNGCRAMFEKCTGLTSADLSSLTNVGGYSCYSMFDGCRQLNNVNLSSLSIISGTSPLALMFENTNLQTLSFPCLKSCTGTNIFINMLREVTGCTVHFPSNMQSEIGSLSDVINGFGGTNTTVLWDLPATNTLTGVDTVTYTRNPKYDTATSLAWKVGAYGTTDFTPAYYTSGTTDPQVSDTIYSDSACTVAVTTVDSIA